MKTAIKLVLIGAALAGGVANAANVNIGTNTATGSSVLLLLRNYTDNNFFLAELPSTLADLRTPAQLQSDTPSQYSQDGINATGPLNVPAALNSYTSANLVNYLAGNGSDNIVWTLMAGFIGNGTDQLGQKALALTSNTDHLANYWDTPTLGGAVGGFGTFVTNDLNDVGVFTNGVSTTNGWEDAQEGSLADVSFNGAAYPNGAAIGTAQSLYLLATGGDEGYAANVYRSAYTFSLSALGVLSYDAPGGSPVPLPAAVWLLGSGLVGLAGVGRRRKSASSVVSI